MLFIWVYPSICMLILKSFLSQQHAWCASQVALATVNLQLKQHNGEEEDRVLGKQGKFHSCRGGVTSVIWRDDESQDTPRRLLNDIQTFIFTSGCELCVCQWWWEKLPVNWYHAESLSHFILRRRKRKERGKRQRCFSFFFFLVTDRHKHRHIISDNNCWTNLLYMLWSVCGEQRE